MNQKVDIEELIRQYNLKVAELAREAGRLKAENDRLKLEKTALMGQLMLMAEDHEYVVFEPDFLVEKAH